MTGVKMLFTHDTEEALAAVVDLVNSDSADNDTLTDVEALNALVARHGWTGRHDRTEAELQEVRALRQRLRPFWDADESGVVEIANELLRESSALPQLVRHGAEPYHLHATTPDAPLAVRMAVEAALAFADVVRAGELDRLRICAYPTCGDVLVDLSKNRSKRFCDEICGNRAAVNAYRSRKAAKT